MSEPTPLRRHEGSLGTIEPGQYAVDGSPLTARCVFVSCPGCGGIEDISLSHGIDADGAVMPMFVCEGPLCRWEGRLVLEGWTG